MDAVFHYRAESSVCLTRLSFETMKTYNRIDSFSTELDFGINNE